MAESVTKAGIFDIGQKLPKNGKIGLKRSKNYGKLKKNRWYLSESIKKEFKKSESPSGKNCYKNTENVVRKTP